MSHSTFARRLGLVVRKAVIDDVTPCRRGRALAARRRSRNSTNSITALRQILAMTDHDQQLRRVAHANYDAAKSPTGDGEAVGSCASDRNRRCASPLRLRRQPVVPVRSVLEWAYGYSDDTIW